MKKFHIRLAFQAALPTVSGHSKRQARRIGNGTAMDAETKAKIATDYRQHETDTGSCEVQVAVLTKRVEELTEHLKTHVKDTGSRRGLMNMVSKRRRLLNYLSDTDRARYDQLISRLGLRR